MLRRKYKRIVLCLLHTPWRHGDAGYVMCLTSGHGHELALEQTLRICDVIILRPRIVNYPITDIIMTIVNRPVASLTHQPSPQTEANTGGKSCRCDMTSCNFIMLRPQVIQGHGTPCIMYRASCICRIMCRASWNKTCTRIMSPR